MNDLFELNFHPNQQELTHGNGPEEGEGPTSSTSASTQDALVNSSAKWRQIPPASGGMAVHRFCHVGAIYKGNDILPDHAFYSQCKLLFSYIRFSFWQWKDLCMFLEDTMGAADSMTL